MKLTAFQTIVYALALAGPACSSGRSTSDAEGDADAGAPVPPASKRP